MTTGAAELVKDPLGNTILSSEIPGVCQPGCAMVRPHGHSIIRCPLCQERLLGGRCGLALTACPYVNK